MDSYRLFSRSFYWLMCGITRPRLLRPNAIFDQMTHIGVLSLPAVGMACLFMGVVLAMQGAYQLRQIGAIDFVADLVGVSMMREIGPLITSVIVIGRSASAVTAELGTMRVSEEVDALEVMAIDPIRYLVIPRVIAMSIMLPCLTILGECLGLVGGGIIAVYSLDMDAYYYGSRIITAIALRDLISGLLKSLLFGILIGFIACRQGLAVEGGAEGVGRATTTSVVQSLTAMLATDCVLTALFYFV